MWENFDHADRRGDRDDSNDKPHDVKRCAACAAGVCLMANRYSDSDLPITDSFPPKPTKLSNHVERRIPVRCGSCLRGGHFVCSFPVGPSGAADAAARHLAARQCHVLSTRPTNECCGRAKRRPAGPSQATGSQRDAQRSFQRDCVARTVPAEHGSLLSSIAAGARPLLCLPRWRSAARRILHAACAISGFE